MEQQVKALLEKGAIKYVPHSNRENGFFIVQKKDGGLRSIFPGNGGSTPRWWSWYGGSLRLKRLLSVHSGSPSWCRHGRGFVYMHFPWSLCSRESWREFAGTGFYYCSLPTVAGQNMVYIYIYAFSRRFYPKRLTIAFRLYIFNQYGLSVWVYPYQMVHILWSLSLTELSLLVNNYILVPRYNIPSRRASSGAPRQEGPSVPSRGLDISPPIRTVETVGLASEEAQLIDSGLSTEAVETILHSRAPTRTLCLEVKHFHFMV